ncbi:MAG TPA: tetratricopeptide repeat protein, partial [Solirubrobacteraceae bacterium]
LAADAPDAPFLLVATARTEATAVVARLQTDSPDAGVLELGPLDEVGLAMLVARKAGTRLGPEAVRAIQERSGGNPFFATEIVRLLLEAGAPLDRAEAWAEAGLPPTVEGLLAARLDRLPPPARRAAEVASAIGDDVPLVLLGAVADDVADVEVALEGLLAADLIEAGPLGDDVLTFRHVLVREAAYGRLPGRRVRALHLRVADEAERLWGDRPDTLDLRARNLHLARAGQRAVDALVAAADRAERLYANEAAVVHLRHALEHVAPDGVLAHAVTLRLADLHELRGEYEAAHARYAALADGPLRAPATIGRATSLRKRGDYPAALGLVDAALGDAARADRAAVLLERGRILMVADSFGAAIASLEAGLPLAEAGSVVSAELLVELARAESSIDRLDAARDHAVAAVAALAAHDDLGRRARALRVLGGVHEDLGEIDAGAEALREGLALARRIGRGEEVASCLLNLGVLELGRGDTAGAVQCARDAAAAFERIGHPSRAAAYANLAEALLLDGDESEEVRG